jgi:hypothetical protein
MSVSFMVEGKVVGRRAPFFSDWHIEIPPVLEKEGHGLTLRELIRFIVSREVDAYQSRQQERRLVHVMSKAAIEEGTITGKVDPGGRDPGQTVDLQESITVALQAFEDGLYFVFIDEVQQTDLDTQVYLNTNSKVVFLRLTALTGG